MLLSVLYRVDTGAALECPISPYSKLAELRHIPMNVDVTRLKDGDGIEETLRRHRCSMG